MCEGAAGRRFFSCCGAVKEETLPLRERYMRLMEHAARRGLECVEEFWRLTPREIAWRLQQGAARLQAGDKMAWIAARYIMLAVHLPEKMPDKPVFYPEQEPDMSAEQMKKRFDVFRGVKKQ